MITSSQIIYLLHSLSSHHRSLIPLATHTLKVLSLHNRNPLFSLLVTHDHNMLIFAYFSCSYFAPCTRQSQIHLHDTSCTFVFISTFFVNIFTLKNTEECQVIRLSITHARFHKANLKIYSLEFLPPKASHYLCKGIFLH